MLNKLRKFLETQGQIRIIEAIVDPETQVEYLEYAAKVRKDFDEEKVKADSDMLFDKNIDIEVKRKLLTQLAAVDDVAIYRKLERYITEADEELKSWALIAHQENQTIIQSSLLEETQILISTGLGGKDQKMRFFIVLQLEENKQFSEIHKSIIKKEIIYAFEKNDCVLENIQFHEFFCMVLGLFPFDAQIESVFKDVLIESNNLGVNLTDKFIITNVKIHTPEETAELIRELDEKAKNDNEDTIEDFDLYDFDDKDDDIDEPFDENDNDFGEDFDDFDDFDEDDIT